MDHRLLNRELSWLDFNERVLRLATEPGIPLLERLKFCAIFSSNLDEFFQVRVAAMKDQEAAGITKRLPDGLTPAQQLSQVLSRVQELSQRQQRLLNDVLLPQLKREGVELCTWTDLTADEISYLDDFYQRRIFPVLTPLAVDPAHPFPYVSNLALSVATIVRDPSTSEERFARVKVPTLFPRLLALPGGTRFVAVEQVIIQNLGSLFPGMEVAHSTTFRVTRNADLSLEDEDADDLLQAVELEYRYAEDTMPRGVLGMNASMFKGYLRYIANRRATQIGLEALFPNEENPFPWMSEMIDLKKERNFFETRVIEYQTGGALSWD